MQQNAAQLCRHSAKKNTAEYSSIDGRQLKDIMSNYATTENCTAMPANRFMSNCAAYQVPRKHMEAYSSTKGRQLKDMMSNYAAECCTAMPPSTEKARGGIQLHR